MNKKAGLRRNNDSSTLPSGFNCCAMGLGVHVFTQPGSNAEVQREPRNVRSWGSSGHRFRATGCLLLATSGHLVLPNPFPSLQPKCFRELRLQGMQDAKAKQFAQRAIDDHARVSAIFSSQFARCWLTPAITGHKKQSDEGAKIFVVRVHRFC